MSCRLSLFNQLSGFLPVIPGQLLQLFPRPFFQLMRPHQAIESGLTNFGDEPWFVFTDVSGQVGIAMLTLKVAVAFVVAGFFAGSYRAVVAGIHLRACVAVATDTRLPCVAGSDEFVKGYLGLLMEVTEGLYCELADFNASSFLLGFIFSPSLRFLYRLLAVFLPFLQCYYRSAFRAAPRLILEGWIKPFAATGVFTTTPNLPHHRLPSYPRADRSFRKTRSNQRNTRFRLH